MKVLIWGPTTREDRQEAERIAERVVVVITPKMRYKTQIALALGLSLDTVDAKCYSKMITSFFNPPIKDTSRNLKASSGSSGGSNTDKCTKEFCEAPYHPYGWCYRGEVYTNR